MGFNTILKDQSQWQERRSLRPTKLCLLFSAVCAVSLFNGRIAFRVIMDDIPSSEIDSPSSSFDYTMYTATNHLEESSPLSAPIVDRNQDHQEVLNNTALWLGEYPRQTIAEGSKLSIVVSHCNRPLHWIQDYVRSATERYNMEIEEITVVSKCEWKILGVMPHSKIRRMPNVGRCDHTYAQWMANWTRSTILNATTSPSVTEEEHNNSYVLFIKDNNYRAEGYSYRTLEESMKIANGNGFACVEPPMQFQGISLSAYHQVSDWKRFNMSSYQGTEKQKKTRIIRPNATNIDESLESLSLNSYGQRIDKEKYKFKSNYSSLGKYADRLRFLNEWPIMIPVCYGGIFLTTKAQIAKRGLEVFEKLENDLSRQDNVEEGHFAERLWAALLTKPLNLPEVEALQEMTESAKCHAHFIPRCGVLARSYKWARRQTKNQTKVRKAKLIRGKNTWDRESEGGTRREET